MNKYCAICKSGVKKHNPLRPVFFCGDNCRSQCSKSISSLLHPSDGTSHLLRSRLKDFLEDPSQFEVSDQIFLDETMKRLQQQLLLQGKPLYAYDLVSDWISLYSDELSSMRERDRIRIVETMSMLNLWHGYL